MRRFRRSDLTRHLDTLLIYGAGVHLVFSVLVSAYFQFAVRNNDDRDVYETLTFFFVGIINPVLIALAIAAVGLALRLAAIFILAMKSDAELEAILGPSRSDRKARRREQTASQTEKAHASMQPKPSKGKS